MELEKTQLIKELLKIIDIKLENKKLNEIIIEQEQLKQREIILKFRELIPKLKKYYNSEMLNCLHKNSLDKQKFPAVNMFRQILKCNNFKMEPYVISKGYDKFSGKKLVERYYRIRDLNNNDEIKEEIIGEINEECFKDRFIKT